ncbi:MAG: FtsX-like permease family protein [Anaerolineae bacterium]|nr:FtsX-like permease family protein [Anaerolineae bacterium]
MLRPRWRKVLADLWSNRLRTLLVVASIGVGVFAIGVIAGTYTMIQHDLADSYAATHPSNIVLSTAPFDPGFADAIARMDGVAQAEGRRHVSLTLRRSDGTWDSISLVAIPRYGESDVHRHTPVEGDPVPADRTVVLEHKSIDALGLQVGDAIAVELADGTSRQIPIVGAVRDQSSVYGSILGDLQGFVTYDTLEWLHQPFSLDRLYVRVSGDAYDEAHVRAVAAQIADRVERSGRAVYSTSIAVGDEHPLSAIVGALLSVLVILGVLVVFLSGALIANTMTALLGQHIRQIGVMKLLGARRSQIIAMYLALLLAFGAMALLVAIPAGSWGAYALARFVAEIINFELRPFRVVPAALLFQLVVALLVPPIAGMRPVLRGSRTTVQRALSSTAYGAGRGESGWIDRTLRRIRAVSRPTLISLRNTFRRKGRLALTLSTLTLGGAVFISVFNAQVSLNAQMRQLARYFGADVNLDFARTYRVEEVQRIALDTPGVVGVEVWATTGGELLRVADGTSDSVAIIAPPVGSALVDPTLLAGRWLLADDEGVVVVNDAFWDDQPDLGPGDTLTVKIAGREVEWRIVGVFQYSGMDDLVLYAPYDQVAGLLGLGYQASAYRIVTADHTLAFQQQVGEQLNARFRDLGFRVGSVEAGKAYSASITDVLGILTAVLLAMAVLTALVGSIGLTGTMSMNVLERTREIGIMRAVGAHNQVIARLVILEGLLIGAISYVLGVLLSFPITLLLSNVISMAIFNAPARLALSALGFLIWLGVVVVLSALSSALPARNASRLTIREVLAYE